ncbi:unnamed protein product [Urochloa humidicola]
MCQITVAIYVFRKCCWWSDDGRLVRAAILLFVPGILKCLEKPWGLKNATLSSIKESPDPVVEASLEKDTSLQLRALSLEKYVREAAKSVRAQVQQESASSSSVTGDDGLRSKVGDEPYHLLADLGHPYVIRLKNLQAMAPRTAREEAHGLVRSSLSKAFDRLYTKHKTKRILLLRAAVVLVTFADIGLFQRSRLRRDADAVVTYVLLCCTAALELVSAACFVLCSGLPLLDDQVAQYSLIGYHARNSNYQWFWNLASRLGFKDELERLWCTAPPQPSAGITKLVYDHVRRGWELYVKPVDEIVITDDEHDDWYIIESAVGPYRRFNDSRGQRTLKWKWMSPSDGYRDRDAQQPRSDPVGASLRLPFDESVLLWHLATEMCYYEHVDTGSDASRHSRVISSYMAYLLFANPDMLVPSARRNLFKAASRELEPSGGEIELDPVEAATLAPPPKTRDEMARKIIQKVKSTIGVDDLVHRAWGLVDELMEFAKVEAGKKEEEDKVAEDARNKKEDEEIELRRSERNKRKQQDREYIERKRKERMEDPNLTEKQRKLGEEEDNKFLEDQKNKRKEEKEEELVMKKAQEVRLKQLMIKAKRTGDDKMWEVIQGVWVEMLCFSASRCRGYLHAKSLATGGEYLSYVWLLLSYMGMETAAERAQRPDLPMGGDLGALIKPLRDDMPSELPQIEEREGGAKPTNKLETKGANNNNRAHPTAMTTATTSVIPVQPVVVGADDNV